MIKEKEIEKRFGGPLTTESEETCLSLHNGLRNTNDLSGDFNRLLRFTTEMAKAFEKAAPAQFRKFYYEDSK